MDDPYLASLGARFCPVCRNCFGHAAGCPEDEPEATPEPEESDE